MGGRWAIVPPLWRSMDHRPPLGGVAVGGLWVGEAVGGVGWVAGGVRLGAGGVRFEALEGGADQGGFGV